MLLTPIIIDSPGNRMFYTDEGRSAVELISSDADNAIEVRANGLYVPLNLTVLTFNDTDTIDLTDTLGTITADVIKDASANNILTSSASGLLARVYVTGNITGLGTAASPLNSANTNWFHTNLNQNANRTHDQVNFTTTVNRVNSMIWDTGSATLLNYLRFSTAEFGVRRSSGGIVSDLLVTNTTFLASNAKSGILTTLQCNVVGNGFLALTREFAAGGEITEVGVTDIDTYLFATKTNQARLSVRNDGFILMDSFPGQYYYGVGDGNHLPPVAAATHLIGVTALGRHVRTLAVTPTCETIETCLGISEEGDEQAYLNEQGDFVAITQLVWRDYSISGAPVVTHSDGNEFIGGYVSAPEADANLTELDDSVTWGSAPTPTNGGYAFIVASGAGAAAGGAGEVEIVISGDSIADDGTITVADTEVLVADITLLTTDLFLKTTKRWVGQITWTIQNAAGGTHTTYSADFNYGMIHGDSFLNKTFEVTGIDIRITGDGSGTTGTGGVFSIYLMRLDDTGWEYHATAFSRKGGTEIASLLGLRPNNETLEKYSSWVRTNLSSAITPADGIAVIINNFSDWPFNSMHVRVEGVI